MKTGLVIEGGGMRGIYAAAVTDKMIEYGLQFDYANGVSAGGANAASFLAGQYKRTYRFYHEYGNEPDFLGLKSWIKTGQLYGLNYIYDQVTSTDGKDPLDFGHLMENPADLELVATDDLSGKPVYFSKADMSWNHYAPLKATCAMPIACKPVIINGIPYNDGGCSNPLPVQRAFDQGCDFVVVVLVKKFPCVHKPRNRRTFDLLLGKYPKLVNAIMHCDELSDLEVRLALEYQKLGKALVIMPEDDSKVGAMTRDKDILEDYYQQGLRDTEAVKDILLEKISHD
jgi:predicted patatin/cPLA2 family phospholipase